MARDLKPGDRKLLILEIFVFRPKFRGGGISIYFYRKKFIHWKAAIITQG